MFVDEIFSGLNYSNFPKISVIENKMNTKEMVKVKGINMISTWSIILLPLMAWLLLHISQMIKLLDYQRLIV